MKVRLQDVVRLCSNVDCSKCRYDIQGECIIKIDGYLPCELMSYCDLSDNSPELAKALYTNEEIELYEDSSKRTD